MNGHKATRDGLKRVLAALHARRRAEGDETIWVDPLDRRRIAFLEIRSALTEEQRTLLYLRVEKELSWARIAEVLSMTGKAVGARSVSRQFSALRSLLAKLARERRLLE